MAETIASKMTAICDAIRAKTGGTEKLNLTAMASELNSIPEKAAATITPNTSNQTIAAGTFLKGAQTILGDSNLVSGNIKKGVNIFNVTGSFTDLNFAVVGGTSQPSSPVENTIWVNTNQTITSWFFSPNDPTNADIATGKVWFKVETSSEVAFNALTSNKI